VLEEGQAPAWAPMLVSLFVFPLGVLPPGLEAVRLEWDLTCNHIISYLAMVCPLELLDVAS